MKTPLELLPTLPRLSREQEADLFRRVRAAKTPGKRKELLSRVIGHYGRWAATVVALRVGQRMTEAEAVSLALDALVASALRFEPNRGFLFSTFFRRRLAGAINNELQKLAEHEELHVYYEGGGSWEPGEEKSLSDDVTWESRKSAVKKALARLDKRSRLVVEMRLKGLTLEDIGMELGYTRERARQLLDTAIVLLRRSPEIKRCHDHCGY